jgi:IS30 family transposase
VAIKQLITDKAVEKTIISLIDLLSRRSYTLTVDNGNEFASYEAVADALRIRAQKSRTCPYFRGFRNWGETVANK